MKLLLLADGKPVTSFMSTDGKTVSLLQLCKTLGEIIRQEFQSKFDSIMEETMIKLSETKDQMSDEERVIHEAIKASYDALENPGSKAWNDRQQKLQQMREVCKVENEKKKEESDNRFYKSDDVMLSMNIMDIWKSKDTNATNTDLAVVNNL